MNPGWRKNYLRYKSYFLNITQSYEERTDVKVYLEILLSLVTISVFTIFALRPTLLTITKLLKEIETKKQTLTQINKKLQDVYSAQNVYDQNINHIRLLESAIPTNPSLDEAVRQIEGLLGVHEVEMTSLSMGKATLLGKETINRPGKESLPENAHGLSFTLGLSASVENYPQIYNYLSNLEGLRRPVYVDLLTVSSTKLQGEDETSLLFILDARLPYIEKGE